MTRRTWRMDSAEKKRRMALPPLEEIEAELQRLQSRKSFHVDIITIHDIRVHVENIRIQLAENACLGRIHGYRLHGNNGICTVQVHSQQRRQRINIKDRYFLRIRWHRNRTVRMVSDSYFSRNCGS